MRSHHLALWLFGLAQELGDSAGGCQVRRSGLIEALGTSVMGQGRRPTLKSAAHDAACVPAACYRRCLQGQRGQPRAKRKVDGAAGSATGALLAPTAPRRAARLGYVPRAQWRRGGWGYRGRKGEQGASEAAQPAAAGLSVTCGCCGQVRRCYCAERAVLPAPDVGWTGGSGG